MFQPPARRIDKMAFGKPTHYYVDANDLTSAEAKAVLDGLAFVKDNDDPAATLKGL